MKFASRLLGVILVLILIAWGVKKAFESWSDYGTKTALVRDSVLHLDLQGVILNGKRFLENLKEYREENKVKAVIIYVNTPGGAVGPSQEIYSEIRRTHEEFKKPVVCYTSGIMASGGYYAALGCNKIVVAPGALLGSIGVIMSFANLERLYDWAKIARYSITSGKYKDSGAEYRPMREDERVLFQGMIDEVHEQFKQTVKEARTEIKEDVLKEYTDGRVFTGKKAVDLGFADLVGTYDQAVEVAAQMAGLKKDHYDIFEVPKHRRSIWEWGEEEDDDTINSFVNKTLGFNLKQVLGLELVNQPVYMMPGVWVD